MQLLYSEIFDKIEKEPMRDTKIRMLMHFKDESLLKLMRLNFDLSVNMDLPPGIPPFKKNDAPPGTEHSLLKNELRKIYIWLDPNCKLSKVRKEGLFISMLEGLNQAEADVFLLCKEHQLQSKYPSITVDLIVEAFPDLPIVKSVNFGTSSDNVNQPEQVKKKRGRKPKNVLLG